MASGNPGAVRILLIDDDEDQRRLLGATIAAVPIDGASPRVSTVADPGIVLDHLVDGGEWIVLLDHRLGPARSTDWLPRLVAIDAGPVVVVTAEGDEQLVREVFRLGASGYLGKDELLAVDRSAARRVLLDARRSWRLERRTRELATSLERANAELRRRNARLGEVAAETHRFVDDVAHDLRGPLASIGCYAEMMAEGMAGPVTGEQQQHLDVIRRSARSLRAMVDDVLDGSRIRTGTVGIDRAAVEMPAVLEELRDLLAPQADARSLTIATSVEPELPPVWADRDRVRRILQNLASNAIRHGRRGTTVRLDARREGPTVRIAVMDQGPGIAEDLAGRIFERFERGRSSLRASSGLGLGLAIALDLAQACLGRLELSTRVGEGSTFSLVLPVAEDGAVRAAAIRRWRDDGATAASWTHVLGVEPASERAVRRWLADVIGTDGVVLPGRRIDRLRVGRPHDEPTELLERLERARAALPDVHAASRVRLEPAGTTGIAPGGGPATGADAVEIEVLPAASEASPPRGRRASRDGLPGAVRGAPAATMPDGDDGAQML